MPAFLEKPKLVTITTRDRDDSTDSSSDRSSIKAPSLKSPRMARFLEATAVNSPIDPDDGSRSPFAESLTNHYMAQAQVGDVGFGYVRSHESVEMPKTPSKDYPNIPKSPLKSPLKSAMRTPGAPPKDFKPQILTPAYHEEYLEKREKHATKRQVKDLRVKTNVRIAKILMRGVNFSCSLIVLAMLATTLNIFRATKDLPPRGQFSPWAPQQKIWPQVTVLAIASVSLFMSIIVIWAYWKGGRKRGQKYSHYYTIFAISFFTFSIVMWGVGAGILQHSHRSNGGKDMWSWSCVKNTRQALYDNDVPYELMCRLQNWSLVCIIIEVVVETITIMVYGIVFYRFYSKRALRKSMAHRDRARSDLYLSQLRSQPNTPGFNVPYSARDGGWKSPADYYPDVTEVEEGQLQYDGHMQYVNADQKHQPAPFRLQAPPIKIQTATPRMQEVGFTPMQAPAPTLMTHPPVEPTSPFMAELVPQETQQEHLAAAPGEQVYDFVAPPGAYEPYEPIGSPGPDQQHFGFAR